MVVIGFQCPVCLEEGSVEVRDRKPGEDLRPWLDQVLRVVDDRHGVIRPTCRAAKVTLRLPLPPAPHLPLGTPSVPA